MIVTYISPKYSKDRVVAQYVRFDGKFYIFCETCDVGFDIRQGFIAEDEIPEDVRLKARELAGKFPSYVDCTGKIEVLK